MTCDTMHVFTCMAERNITGEFWTLSSSGGGVAQNETIHETAWCMVRGRSRDNRGTISPIFNMMYGCNYMFF